MKLQNLHTHTVFGDGECTPRRMTRSALAAGCGSLGFSEHSPLPPAIDTDGWTMAPEELAAYQAEVRYLQRRLQGRLEVFLGLEQDYDSPPPDGDYDYLIGSVHGVEREGVPVSVDESAESFAASVAESFGGDGLAIALAYYERAGQIAERTGCQIVGHFDLVTKFNQGGRFFDEEDPRYVRAALEALEANMDKDVIFEINTGAVARGYRTLPYPAPFLLRAIREKGGRVCITSDSHSAHAILHSFPLAAQLALECGFRETWVLTRTGFQAVGLEEFLAAARQAEGTRHWYQRLGKKEH